MTIYYNPKIMKEIKKLNQEFKSDTVSIPNKNNIEKLCDAFTGIAIELGMPKDFLEIELEKNWELLHPKYQCGGYIP